MNKLALTVIAAAAMAVDCSHGPKELPVFKFVDDFSTANNLDALRASLVLKPEVTDSSLIKSPNLRGIHDGVYYIAGDRLMTFRADGKLVSSFTRNGNGPGEWGNAYNVATQLVNPATGNWDVLLYDGKKTTYTIDGRFVGTDSVGRPSAINSFRNGFIAANQAMPDTVIVLSYLDSNMKATDSLNTGYRHRVYEFPGGMSSWNPTLKSTGKNAYFISWSDTVYNVSSPAKRLEAIGFIDINGLGIPESVSPSDPKKDYLRFLSYITDNALMLFAGWDEKIHLRVYYLATGRLLAAYSCPTADFRGIPFEIDGKTINLMPSAFTTADAFYFYATDSEMTEFTGNEDSNPAFFEVKLAE